MKPISEPLSSAELHNLAAALTRLLDPDSQVPDLLCMQPLSPVWKAEPTTE